MKGPLLEPPFPCVRHCETRIDRVMPGYELQDRLKDVLSLLSLVMFYSTARRTQ